MGAMAEKTYIIPTPGQLRAARAWIGWNLDEASASSGVHKQTISRIESEASGGSLDTLRRLVECYEQHGIVIEVGALRYVEPSRGRPRR